MLRWIGRKYMEMQEVREENRKNGEMGFTLIELLVVVIIIGILAAIAIPTFLSQRQNAYEAQTKSDLRNAVTNAEAFYTTNNGTYEGLTQDAIQKGLSPTNTTLAVSATPALSKTNYCLTATNKNTTGVSFYYLKSADAIKTGTGCTGT